MDILANIELKTKFRTTTIQLSENTDWNNKLFSILEHGQCQITFMSDFPDSKLWLEYMNEEGGVYLYPNQSFELVKTNLEDEGYVPGEFILSVYKDLNTQYNGYFTVTPNTFTQDTLDLMRQCIEDKAYGLSRNLHLKKKGCNRIDYSEDDLYILSYLVNNINYIKHTLLYVEKNPIVNLTQIYNKVPISRKPTVKSQRWQAVRGNVGGINQTGCFFEPKKVLSDENKANQCIKYQLYTLLGIISQLRTHHTFLNTQLYDKYNQLRKEIEVLLLSSARIKDNFNTTKSSWIISHELEIKQQELKKYKNQIESYQDQFKPVNDLHSSLVYLLNETWLNNIKLVNNKTFSKSLLKDKGYLNLYSIMQELNKKQDIGNTNFSFPHHQTTKLFEFYCVLLVIDIIQSKGFNWESGWIKEQIISSKLHTYTLDSGEEMSFVHDSGYMLKLSYDKFLNTTLEARRQGIEQLVSVNSSSRRPDIILELFDNNKKFIRAFIIEVKYRRLKYLYNGQVDTNAMRQLIDYRGLNYYDPSQTPALIPVAIDSVIVLYPECNDSILLEEEDYGFKFIPILPTDFNITDTKFDMLITSIDRFLKQFVPNY